MTVVDKVYIAVMAKSGGTLLKRSGIVKAICKEPRDAVTALNPSLKKVSVRVPERDKSGVTIFKTASRGDVMVIDLDSLYQAQCQTLD